jgi:hypothetical protein
MQRKALFSGVANTITPLLLCKSLTAAITWSDEFSFKTWLISQSWFPYVSSKRHDCQPLVNKHLPWNVFRSPWTLHSWSSVTADTGSAPSERDAGIYTVLQCLSTCVCIRNSLSSFVIIQAPGQRRSPNLKNKTAIMCCLFGAMCQLRGRIGG